VLPSPFFQGRSRLRQKIHFETRAAITANPAAKPSSQGALHRASINIRLRSIHMDFLIDRFARLVDGQPEAEIAFTSVRTTWLATLPLIGHPAVVYAEDIRSLAPAFDYFLAP
jgi:hypothetical protein